MTLLCICSLSYQSHVISQYPPTDSLWPFSGIEACDAVVVELSFHGPEGWQTSVVLTCTHPGQSLLLVGQQRSAHRLQER